MNLRYQEWLTHVFGHEIIDPQRPEWYFAEDAPVFDASANEITELFGLTFLHAGSDLIKYTDAQVDQGVWYMVSIECSDFIMALQSPEVTLAKRLETIGNIFQLYSDCFAKRCSESLGHLNEEGSPLNSSCYMFWDMSHLDYMRNGPDSLRMQDAALDVLTKILTIEHRACRESALYGLSGYALTSPERTHQIIDQFLSRTKPDDKLLAYALKAREGNVL
jgi:hypothetical protein